VDFWDLTKLLVRRWWVAVPLILLTAVGAVGLAATIKPDYIADSYITMVGPRGTQAEGVASRNPWLQSGLVALGSAAIYSTQDASVVDRMVKQGFSDNFTLAFDGNTPIIKIEVTAASKAQAKGTVDYVADLFSQSVKLLQAESGPRDDEYITTRRLDQGDNLKSSTTKLKRAVIAIVGAGLLMTIAATAIVDTILQRRSRRKAMAAASPAPAPTPRKGREQRVTNGSAHDLSGLRERETEIIGPGVEPPVRVVPSRDKRAPHTGEYRSVVREKADETAVFPAATDEPPPMPSDATMILPLPDKEAWPARDSRGTNRGGNNRR
jgi:capsular polysaccharide biosynthesis protein